MAEQKKQAEVAPHAIMSEEEASALQREIILNGNNPDYKLPDGRTVAQVREAQAARDAQDRKEADEFERSSLAVNTPRVAEVALRVQEDGAVVASPHSETPAATQLVKGEGDAAPHAAGDELAADFPAREALAAAGYTLRSQLSAMADEELTAVSGIGPATAAKVREALAAVD